MDGGLLSLKWNNHRSTFFYVLSNVRKKECYTDVTLACDGKFYPVHKLVLSTCSEYFEQMFEQTQCKHPVIVLKDIRSEELESLLSYMYVGEVNVVQEKLSGLIKAAECLRIKGLAVPDEEPCSKPPGTSREKRSSDNSLNSEPKRRRQDDSGNTSSFRQAHSNNRNDDRRKSLDHPSSSTSNKFRNTNSSNSNVNSSRASSGDRETGDRGSTSSRTERLSSPASNNQHHAAADVKTEEQAEAADAEAPDEVTIDEPNEPVKQEPVDLDAVYLSDSNSASEAKDILMDNFGDSDGQQHFMDELLGQNSGSDQGNMGVGDYSEGGEGSSSAPSGAGGQQQQQHMVGWTRGSSSLQASSTSFSSQVSATAPVTRTTSALPSDASWQQQPGPGPRQEERRGGGCVIPPLRYPASVTATPFYPVTVAGATHGLVGSSSTAATKTENQGDFVVLTETFRRTQAPVDGLGTGAPMVPEVHSGPGSTTSDQASQSSLVSYTPLSSPAVSEVCVAMTTSVTTASTTTTCSNVAVTSASSGALAYHEHFASIPSSYGSLAAHNPILHGASSLSGMASVPFSIGLPHAGFTGAPATGKRGEIYGVPHPLTPTRPVVHTSVSAPAAVSPPGGSPHGSRLAITSAMRLSGGRAAPAPLLSQGAAAGGSSVTVVPRALPEPITLTCPHCSRVFSKMGFLKRHIKEIHGSTCLD